MAWKSVKSYHPGGLGFAALYETLIKLKGRRLEMEKGFKITPTGTKESTGLLGVDTDGDGTSDQFVEMMAHINHGPNSLDLVNVRAFRGKYGQSLLFKTQRSDKPLPAPNSSTNSPFTLGIEVYVGKFLGNGCDQIAVVQSNGSITVFGWNPNTPPVFE